VCCTPSSRHSPSRPSPIAWACPPGNHPPWYLVAQNDEAIPPEAQRRFAARMGATIAEVSSSHLPMVSHPREVSDLIEKAAEAAGGVAAAGGTEGSI
jgi:pimeloyl-ACP methyl ester carboxylesterase